MPNVIFEHGELRAVTNAVGSYMQLIKLDELEVSDALESGYNVLTRATKKTLTFSPKELNAVLSAVILGIWLRKTNKMKISNELITGFYKLQTALKFVNPVELM